MLANIFRDLKKDAQKDRQYIPRLTVVSSAITQFYLKQYDLERAIEPWRSMNRSRDILLQSILAFYKTPGFYAITLAMLSILTLLPSISMLSELVNIAAFLASVLFGITLAVSVLGILTILIGFLFNRGMDYIELFLPRLLGAIVVGLSILVFQDTGWYIGLNIDGLNWLLVCMVTYTASFAYIFTDVHKTTRLLPSPDEPMLLQNQTRVINNPTSRSLKTTRKVFFIGLFESLAASLLVSSVLGLAVLPEQITRWFNNGSEFLHWEQILEARTLIDPEQGLLGFAWRLGGISTFAYFPKLVLLWTGLALLIGTFAQLLWQDRQITSS